MHLRVLLLTVNHGQVLRRHSFILIGLIKKLENLKMKFTTILSTREMRSMQSLQVTNAMIFTLTRMKICITEKILRFLPQFQSADLIVLSLLKLLIETPLRTKRQF